MIIVDLCKQQALDVGPKAAHQINFNGNLDQAGNTAIFSLLKKQKKPFWIFHQELWEHLKCVCFNIKWHNIYFECKTF